MSISYDTARTSNERIAVANRAPPRKGLAGVCRAVGVGVGSAKGLWVGLADGSAEGSGVGLAVGSAEGREVGSAVGSADGPGVGLGDGLSHTQVLLYPQ